LPRLHMFRMLNAINAKLESAVSRRFYRKRQRATCEAAISSILSLIHLKSFSK
jgi:hypothetical protein